GWPAGGPDRSNAGGPEGQWVAQKARMVSRAVHKAVYQLEGAVLLVAFYRGDGLHNLLVSPELHQGDELYNPLIH
ncbi:MAG: hypothetical protein ACK456_13935, partial [Pseudanabaenaceae cyanobacterium]